MNILIAHKEIATVAALVLLLLAWLVWPKKKTQRLSDSRKVNRHEKEKLKAAERLAKSDPVQAARLLESIRFYREAIELLEESGKIREAAQILYRLGRPNRAGILLRRHNFWKEASQAFEKACMPREAAESAKKSGDVYRAVKFFTMVNDLEELASCFMELGSYSEAARAYIAMGAKLQALNIYPTILQNSPELANVDFTEPELNLIRQGITAGQADLSLARILIRENKVVHVVADLAKMGAIRKACDIYLMCPMDIGPELIGEKDLTRQENLNLAEVFVNVSNYELAGKVFERSEEYYNAGEAFAKAEFWERAAYCFERSGAKEKAVEMRIALASSGQKEPKKPKPVRQGDNPFILDSDDQVEAAKSRPEDRLTEAPKAKVGEPVRFQKPKEPPAVVAASMEAASEPGALGAAPTEVAQDSLVFQDMEKTNVVAAEDTQAHLEVARWLDKYPHLLSAPLLQLLPELDKIRLLGLGELKEWQEGECLQDFGEAVGGLILIVAGKVVAQARVEGRPRDLFRVSLGSALNETAILADQAWELRYCARSTTQGVLIPRRDLQNFLATNVEVGLALYKKMTEILINEMKEPDNRRILLKSAS